jgi:uroporphyrinogen decarboxylase
MRAVAWYAPNSPTWVEPSPANPLGAVHGEGYAVRTHEDWLALTKRFQGADLDRYLCRCGEPQIVRCAQTRFPVELKLPGPFGRMWVSIGLYGPGGVLESLYDRPAFLEEMIEFWVTFACDLGRPALERLAVDFATIEDGLAYDGGAFLSPDLLRRFIAPAYRKITDFLYARGVPVVLLNSGGSLNPLLLALLEAGIGGITHIAAQAEMDLVALKREYGPSLRLIGGIDRRVLFRSNEEISREIERVMPAVDKGGVIPGLDGSVLYGTPFCRYEHFGKSLGKRLGVR